MLLAVAIVAATAPCIGHLAPIYIYGPITSDLNILSVGSPIGPDGRKGTYNESEWAALIAQMSSPAVLDTALADPRIARLSLFQGLGDPRAALSSKFQISVAISGAETESQTALNVLLLHVGSVTAVQDIADALASAIAAKGPAGVAVVGRPMSIMILPIGEVPWYRDWRLYTIGAVTLAALLALLVLHSKPKFRINWCQFFFCSAKKELTPIASLC